MDKILELLFFILCGLIVSIDVFFIMMVRGAQKAELRGAWTARYALLFAALQIVGLKVSNIFGLWLHKGRFLWILPKILLFAAVGFLLFAGVMMLLRGHKAESIPERRMEKLETKPAVLILAAICGDALLFGLILGLASVRLTAAALLVIALVSAGSTWAGAETGYRQGFDKQKWIHGAAAAVLLAAAVTILVLTLRTN